MFTKMLQYSIKIENKLDGTLVITKVFSKIIRDRENKSHSDIV